jgi:hypothetical protein
VTAAIQIPPEVAAIPVFDIPPAQVGLAWKAGQQTAAIHDLVGTALTTLRPGP